MNENTITYEDIRSNPKIRTYIQKADEMLSALGFTEHSFAHVTLCAQKAGDLKKVEELKKEQQEALEQYSQNLQKKFAK